MGGWVGTEVDWVGRLSASGPVRDRAVGDLLSLARRVASAEVRRRGLAPGVSTPAAAAAVAAMLAQLDDYTGESRFTTWVAKYVVRGVSSEQARMGYDGVPEVRSPAHRSR